MKKLSKYIAFAFLGYYGPGYNAAEFIYRGF